MRAFAVLLVGALLAGCAETSQRTEPTVVPSQSLFPVLSIKSLVLPVADLPGGTKSTSEGPFELSEYAMYENQVVPMEVETVLRKNGFLSAYFREFEFLNDGPNPLANSVFVVLFQQPSGARSALVELTEIRLRYGYREMSLGARIGDDSRGMVAEFAGTHTAAERPLSVADVLFADANALVLARSVDDLGTLKHLDAIQFARAELAWLRH